MPVLLNTPCLPECCRGHHTCSSVGEIAALRVRDRYMYQGGEDTEIQKIRKGRSFKNGYKF
jgi:hypothetical protein